MVRRVLTKYPRSIYKGIKETIQHFNYLLVLDFECTCKQYEKINPQEIIEFPCAAVSTTTWEIENVFHEYIKPRIHPQLTPFCTSLTGILQDMVDKQPHFPEVFDKFCNWLKQHNYFNDRNNCAFVTCGDWDLKCILPAQCTLEKISLPKEFSKWINLKGSFCDATHFYPRSLKDMLTKAQLPLEGKLHSGLDDVKNMVKIIQFLQQHYNFQFKINSAHTDVLKQLIKCN